MEIRKARIIKRKMREDELRESANCDECGKGFLHTGLPTFYRITVERYIVDIKALQRQAGLTVMLDGHAALARIMGPNERLAKKIWEPVKITLCENCSTNENFLPLTAMAFEKVTEQENIEE